MYVIVQYRNIHHHASSNTVVSKQNRHFYKYKYTVQVRVLHEISFDILHLTAFTVKFAAFALFQLKSIIFSYVARVHLLFQRILLANEIASLEQYFEPTLTEMSLKQPWYTILAAIFLIVFVQFVSLILQNLETKLRQLQQIHVDYI